MTPHHRPLVSALLRAALLLAAMLLPSGLRAQACLNTHADVARAAFVQVLRREAEPTAVSAYTAYLNGGQMVRALVSELANSAEYRDRFIIPHSGTVALTLLYRHLLAREPDANAWGYVNIAQTSGWGVVISSLLNSQEYTDRFGDRAVPGDPVVAWDCLRPGLTLEPATAAPILERDLCVTAAIGSGAAYECGDLRLAHALPTIRTLNKERTPVLVYNHQHANPYPQVTAYLTIPAGMTADSVRMTLLGSNGAVMASRTVAAWPGGQERHTGVSFNGLNRPTGLYAYTLQVRLTSGATTLATYSMKGEFGIVNRNASPFGAGWWLAGLERLNFLADGRIMWVGGDGSYRVYRPIEGVSGKWAAAHVSDRPDTLYTTSYPHSAYERRLPGGARVIYNGAGYHAATVNRLDHATSFGYHGDGSLGAIYIPHGPGYGLTNVQYRFNYGGVAGRLVQVASTELGGNVFRAVGVIHDTNGRVTSITDPGLDPVHFGYNRYVPMWMDSIADRRGTVTRYYYNNLKLSASVLEMQGTGANIQSNYRPHEATGLMTQPQPSNLVYTRLDGPRTDVGDTTALYLDRWGAPRRIRDALGNQTVLYRENAAYPALVTRSVAPNGFTQRAEFDALGRVRRVLAENARGDGAVDPTRYEYDNASWPDFATRIVPPEGDSVVIAYRGDGGRHSQTDAKGRTVYFRYYESGSHRGMLRATDSPASAPDSVAYDPSLGNLSGTWTPLGAWTRVHTDHAGDVVRVVTPVGPQPGDTSVVSTFRDAAGQDTLVRTTGPALPYTLAGTPVDGAPPVAAEWVVVRSAYDEEGNPLNVEAYTEPDAESSTTSSYTYDRAGRKLTELVGRKQTNYVYDRAGNVVDTWNDRGLHTTATYDALNRPISRTTAEVVYPAQGCEDHPQGYAFACPYRFPLYPNNTTGGLTIPNDVATFAYDAMGNMVAANNRSARISRTYYPGGMLRTDTLRIARYAAPGPNDPPCGGTMICPPEVESMGMAGPSSVAGDPYPDEDFTLHVYGLAYSYDRNGRITTLRGPGFLLPTQRDSTAYGYNHVGELASVRDPQGNQFSFEYDNDGRPSRTNFPGGAYEIPTYDDDGRMTTRSTFVTNGTGILRADTLTYDVRGKVLTVADGNRNRIENRYSGLGVLVASSTTRGVTLQNVEEFRASPLGHMYWSRSRDVETGTAPITQYAYAAGTSAVARKWFRDTANAGSPTVTPDTSYFKFDLAWNVQAAGHTRRDKCHLNGCDVKGRQTLARSAEKHYYGGDDRLRFLQRYDWTAERNNGTFDEYRYDALGRRVLMRMRRDSLCSGSADCTSAIERYIWSGDQLLYEIRSPGGDARTAAELAYDNSTGDEFGRVGYTHAAGIDAPLSVIRIGHGSGPATIVPHSDYRGTYDAGTSTSGSSYQCGVNDPCLYVVWPKQFGSYYAGGDPSRGDWAGSLIRGQQDISGLMYRRNRYYNPETGQFTQSDPIGIAGGLNTYGFANGDPASYGDPYGLEPECGICARLLLGGLARAGLIRGAVFMGAGGVRLLSAGLRGYERMGGHTLARHVNVNASHLARRLASSPHLTSASRFTNLRTADGAVGGAIQSNAANVQRWLAGNGGTRLAFTHQVGQPIGEVLHRGASSPVASSTVRVLLERSPKSPTGYTVITAYPQ